MKGGRGSSSDSIISIFVTLDLSRRKHCSLSSNKFAFYSERSLTILEPYVYWKFNIMFCSLDVWKLLKIIQNLGTLLITDAL